MSRRRKAAQKRARENESSGVDMSRESRLRFAPKEGLFWLLAGFPIFFLLRLAGQFVIGDVENLQNISFGQRLWRWLLPCFLPLPKYSANDPPLPTPSWQPRSAFQQSGENGSGPDHCGGNREDGLNSDTVTSGLRGLAISLAVVIFPFALIFLASDMLADLHTVSDARWLGEFFRKSAISRATICIIIFAIYWIFSGLLGKGRIDDIKSANLLLTVSFIIIWGMTATSIFPILPHFDSLCDTFPYSGKVSLFELHKCPTSEITHRVVNILLLLLVLSSGIVRIILSRRRHIPIS
ncbi:hypothetical protein C8024_01790 [Sphingopyxis sp. BSNA05]|nr:hypothetical protein [Sphingopyxis sp. BSNA05]